MYTDLSRSAVDIARDVRQGRVSPVALVEATFECIEERDVGINAYTTLIKDARERAREAEEAVERGENVGPLHGVPIGIKDLFAFKAGVRNTFGSRAFAEFVPEEDALVVERLENAGAIVVGKTNTPELGRKATTDNDLFPATGTPFDPSKTAGGSSGGSAAAVATGMAALAHGSDAAGSIRIPAAACGIVGHKPSRGRVAATPRPNGFLRHTPFIESGPLARTVEDAALMLEVMAGPHERDPLCVPDDGADYVAATRRSIDDLRVAFSPDLGICTVDPAVVETVRESADALRAAGAVVEHADPEWGHDWTTLHDSFLVELRGLYAETALRLRDTFGVDPVGEDRELFTDPVVERMEAGLDLSAAAFRKADWVRTDAVDAMADLFEEYDLLLSPTLSVTPFDKNRDGPGSVAGTDVETYHGWLLTWPFNMTGHPAASIPAGLVDGLPVGVQLVGPQFDDETVLAAAAAVERTAPWRDWYPVR
jgi:Asp-tRNA(Asn)/Glu-tRNA(Gln) amidotransferase A subunit family amidase